MEQSFASNSAGQPVVTIKDIARALGVSPSTVTRALTGSGRIGAETARRVRETAEAMGYVADAAARAMQRGSATLVGLLVPDIQNPFYATMARTVARACDARDHQLVLSLTEDDAALEERHVRALIGARCAGVLLVPAPGLTESSLRMLHGVPAVQIIRRCPGLATDGVGIDDHDAVRTAAGYLLDLGHRRVGLLCGREPLDTAAARRAGFARAFDERGLALDPDLVQAGEPRADAGREAAARLLAMHPCPSAIVAAGSALTEGLLEAVSAAPGGAGAAPALVGFGDTAALRWWQGSGLTTISLPVPAIAEAACERLFAHIDGRAGSTPAFQRFATGMLLRGSTRPANGAG